MHLFIRDGAPLIRVFQTPFYHHVEGKFTNDLIIGAVVWQLLKEFGNLFFGGGHCFVAVDFSATSFDRIRFAHRSDLDERVDSNPWDFSVSLVSKAK